MTQKGPTVRHRFSIFCWTTDHEIGQCSLLSHFFPSPPVTMLWPDTSRHLNSPISHHSASSPSYSPPEKWCWPLFWTDSLETGQKCSSREWPTNALHQQNRKYSPSATHLLCDVLSNHTSFLALGLACLCVFVYLFTSTRWDPSNGSAGWPAGSPSPLVLLELQSATTQKHAPVMTMHSHKHHTALLCFWKQTNQKKTSTTT